MKRSFPLMLFISVLVSLNLLAGTAHKSLYLQDENPYSCQTSIPSENDNYHEDKTMATITKENYITDNRVNKVYTSSLLPKASSGFDPYVRVKLNKALQEWAGNDFTAITNTKDVWMRDFMPIQVTKDIFIAYIYAPDYLSNAPMCVTDWRTLNVECLKNKRVITMPLILDGGNVVKAINKDGTPCMILCDKVLVENEILSEQALLRLRVNGGFDADPSVCKFKKWWAKWWKDNFNGTEMKPVLLPWEGSTENPIGHADGMVRYLCPGNVLLTNYIDFDEQQYNELGKENCDEEKFRSKMLREALEKAGFSVKELSYYNDKKYRNNSSYRAKFDLTWCYINFLQLGHRILVPRIGNQTIDEEARREIERAFNKSSGNNYTSESIDVDMTSIVTEPEHWANSENGGGALNCLTWTIYE